MKHIQESIRKTRGYTDRFWLVYAVGDDFDHVREIFRDNFRIFLKNMIMIYCLSDDDIRRLFKTYDINDSETGIYLVRDQNLKTYKEIEDHFTGMRWDDIKEAINDGTLLDYGCNNIKKLLGV